ncbi:hypothetical protein CWI39_0075p0020 [Hamiltosporidium magnivora]|uniref:RRM Nup35-type domain-containing protein n=1 Tax=Hamiltosporidium magnivora TaxID=148818 RepID=A0A4Q9LN76_9MICR|nr:hypothetical protein CWI39_0075p0020 [Hamiltosporidium magnivora]
MENNYYPKLFNTGQKEKTKEYVETKEEDSEVPLLSLEDETLLSRNPCTRRYVTVFGFSLQNSDYVISQIKKCGEIKRIEYGKNWVDVEFEYDYEISKCLALNNIKINGEIIGCFRNGIHVAKTKDVFSTQRKGLIGRILEYFLGR